MLKQTRFSDGQETTTDICEKARIGRFSDGQELLSPQGRWAGECSCC